MGNNVAVSRAATTSMNTLSDPLSIPPNTHLPSLSLPLLYLRLPNLDSSISTIFPGPPIGANHPSRYAAQTSRQKWHQSTAVLQLISHHLMMVLWGKSSVQRYVISRIVSKDKWLPWNHESALMDLAARQAGTGQRHLWSCRLLLHHCPCSRHYECFASMLRVHITP